MNNQRFKPTQLYRNTVLALSQLSIVVLLSACGSGNEDSPSTVPSAASGNVSTSASQLAADGTTTLSLAQASAAGLVIVPSVESSQTSDVLVNGGDGNSVDSAQNSNTEPDVGAALPTEEIPSTNAVTDNTVTEAIPTANTDNSSSGAGNEQNATPDETSNNVDAATDNSTGGENTDSNNPALIDSDSANEQNTVTDADSLSTNDNGATATGQKNFTASNTDGFTGELRDDGSVKVAWRKDPTARGYNVYRQAEYVTTVFAEEYIDTDIYDESYYYEIQAFDYDENYNYVATGLTVNVTGTGRINPDSPKKAENVLDGYELVFSDEFNGTELDKSKWVTSYLWGDELVINSEEQHYVDIVNKPDFGYNPFSFDGEALTISSIETPDHLKDKAFGQKYLSGVITSYDAFKFTYGYVETRAQVPFGRGLWPAFWLLNAYYVEDKPEIDIFEFIGHNQDIVYHTYHYYDSDGNLRSTHSEPSAGVDYTNGYHTYAVEWLPGTLIFYVDGVEKHRVNDSKVSQQDMYIIANTALGGWWPGSPDSSTPFPAEYKIDYIRAYQKAGGQLQSDPNQGLPSNLLLWDDVPGASPGHLPPIELWPEGYPEKQ